MKVINFFGGPGAGKTTLAAMTFVELKKWGVNAELVSEYAKQLVYDGRMSILEEDQVYVLAKQNRKLMELKGSGMVDYAVSDSPLLLSSVYNREYAMTIGSDVLDPLVMAMDAQYDDVNFLIRRDPKMGYLQEGRIQSLEEAKEIDAKIEAFLEENNVPYHAVDYNDKTVDKVIDVLYRLKLDDDRRMKGPAL